jgi:hypothetical protein
MVTGIALESEAIFQYPSRHKILVNVRSTNQRKISFENDLLLSCIALISLEMVDLTEEQMPSSTRTDEFLEGNYHSMQIAVDGH